MSSRILASASKSGLRPHGARIIPRQDGMLMLYRGIWRCGLLKRLAIPLAVLLVGVAGIVLGIFCCDGETDWMPVDPETGLHITGKPVEVDIATYQLKVTGKVDKEVSLSYEEILLLEPKVTATPELVCPGYFVDVATWSGVPLATVLQMAEPDADASWVRMRSADGYSIKVELEVALDAKSFLAYELEGETLPVSQGFPLRAVFPEEEGNRWVKWLTELEVE